MTHTRSRWLPDTILLAMTVLCTSGTALCDIDPFAIIMIPDDGGTYTTARGINNLGAVTGSSSLDDYAYIFHNGRIEVLDIPDGMVDSDGFAINSFGAVAGRSEGSDYRLHATFWDRNTPPVLLGDFGGNYSMARSINDSNQIVGSASDTDGFTRAFYWADGVLTDLGTLGGDVSIAYEINENGLIVGYAENAEGTSRASVWRVGVIEELPDLGDKSSFAYGVNDQNEVVGRVWEVQITPVMWSRGGIKRLQYPPVFYGEYHGAVAEHINNNGVITGYINKWASDYTRPIVWPSPDDMAVSVYRLLPPLSRWHYIGTLQDINDLNQIVGFGNYGPGDGVFHKHAFLLTPVYPSFDLTEFSPGVSGQMSTIEAHNVPPGATVHFLGARWGGGALIPTCDVTRNALQLEDPRQLGTAVADEGGVAVIEGLIPDEWAGREILFQAFVRDSCEISNLVVQAFE
ncbi:MAG: hypothetical protein D8M59_14885 [Planctomycetes bacterium]|nr:hypothetical protein [Planctomycetota bacterium]NOG55023.1 hypothetical protein [Planctomycetota bacterium]